MSSPHQDTREAVWQCANCAATQRPSADHPDRCVFCAGERGFTPMRAELPLDGLEAFRLASFNIEYVPQFAPIVMDRDCFASRFYTLPSDRYQHVIGPYVANVDALGRFFVSLSPDAT